MAEGKGLAITALALGILGLFTLGGLGAGSLLGLALAGVALTGASSRGSRDVAWAAVAANIVALLTLFPAGAGLWAYRASPLSLVGDDDALPVPAPPAIEEALPEVPPPPPPEAPVRVGGGIREPRKTRHVDPVYPKDAIASRVQGVVILECTISPAGKVVLVETLRSVPLLDEAAIEAVRQWEYTPTLLAGTPVPVVMTVTVNFELN